eukprot:1149404-Pelagomonas_calceolata.AAC.4
MLNAIRSSPSLRPTSVEGIPGNSSTQPRGNPYALCSHRHQWKAVEGTAAPNQEGTLMPFAHTDISGMLSREQQHPTKREPLCPLLTPTS